MHPHLQDRRHKTHGLLVSLPRRHMNTQDPWVAFMHMDLCMPSDPSGGVPSTGRWRGAMVAVKIVTHDRTLATLAETLRESALSTSIQHPNVVRTLVWLGCLG